MKLLKPCSVYVLMAGGVLLGCAAGLSPVWRPVLLAAGVIWGAWTIRHWGWLLWLFLAASFVSAVLTVSSVPLEPRYGTMEILLTDARLTRVPGLPPPAVLQGELRRFAPSGENFSPCCGEKVQLFWPDNAPLSAYGSVITVTGRLLPPGGGYDYVESGRRLFREDGYAEFLRLRRASAVIAADRVVRVDAPRKTLLSRLYGWRDRIVGRLLEGVRDPEIRATSAALTFGLTGGVRGELRRRYVDAGTVHLFSVSGMHVMLLAGLLTLLCRWLPFQPRQLVVAGGCFLYAAATGFNTPALRAWLLVAAWCTLRARLFFIPATSLLLAVGSLLLLIQPQLLADAGFQYTFLITAALLLYNRRISGERAAELERFSWMASGPEKRRAEGAARRRRDLRRAAGAAAVAFLAALPITLRLQGEVPPGALAANMLLVLLLPLIFPALLLKLLLGGSMIGVWVWELPFRLLNVLAGVTQEGVARIAGASPPVWCFVLYEALLFLALTQPYETTPWRRRLAAGMAGCLLLGFFVWPHFQKPFILMAHTGCDQPPQCAVCDPVSGYSAALLFPGTESARALAAELKRRGINRIGTLCVAGNSRSSTLAVHVFTRQVAVDRQLTPPRAAGMQILQKKSGFLFAYPGNPCTVRNRLSCERSDRGWLIRFSGGHPGGVLPFTSCPEVHCYEY